MLLVECEDAKTVLEALLTKGSEEAVSLREKSRSLVALSVIEGIQGDTKNGNEKIKELRLSNLNSESSAVKKYLGLIYEKESFAS